MVYKGGKYKGKGAKEHDRRKYKQEISKKNCLNCQKEFTSYFRYHFMCDYCRKNT